LYLDKPFYIRYNLYNYFDTTLDACRSQIAEEGAIEYLLHVVGDFSETTQAKILYALANLSEDCTF
jgi:hypothetical protein